MASKDVLPTAVTLVAILKECLDKARVFSERFIVPDDFLPHHPERKQMVAYLKALAWKGTESGAADSARVPLTKVRKEWRKIPEFAELEQMADEACTDLAEETALMLAYVNGDQRMIERVLKGRRGEKYNDRQELTGKGGGAVEFKIDLGGVPRPQRLDD